MITSPEVAKHDAPLGLPMDTRPFSFSDDDALLVIGPTVDEIVTLVPPIQSFHSLNEWLRHLEELVTGSLICDSKDVIREAILRTSCANAIKSDAMRDGTVTSEHLRLMELLLLPHPRPPPQRRIVFRANFQNSRWKSRFDDSNHTREEDAESDDDENKPFGIEFSLPPLHMPLPHTPPSQTGHLTISNLATNYIASIAKLDDDLRLFITRRGYLGLGPLSVDVGDEVCIFSTAKMPHVIRKSDSRGGYTLVGVSYVHGIMNGEFKVSRRQEFKLI